MIVGIGTDVVAISRIAKVLAHFGDKFLVRVLTPQERSQRSARGGWTAPRLARRWAIKEAVAKALGTGIGGRLSWQDIDVRYNPLGQPRAVIKGHEKLVAHVTTSDDEKADTAVAFCVLEEG